MKIRERLIKSARKLRRTLLWHEPGYYDMFENKGEQYFARLYLHYIVETLRAEGRSRPLEILDAGCQTGYLTSFTNAKSSSPS